MGYWNSRGLRGSGFEESINYTNDIYRQNGLGLIQKIPTPITPVEIQKDTGRISLAYFNSKSTVDYIGVIQGIGVCFDAKETNAKNFPIQNIHEHQIEFMRDFEKQGGIAFILVYFRFFGRYFYLPISELIFFWERAQNGGRKSIKFEEFEKGIEVFAKDGGIVHYIEAVAIYLERKDKSLEVSPQTPQT